MSASSKKKLRNEQSAEKMTERQQAEQKEAKKLKIYTIVFSVVLAVMLVFAVGTLAYRAVSNSGILERNTTAVTVGEHELSNAELNYFYIDTINNFYNQYSGYISYFLDTSKALDKQIYNNETGETWADYFLSGAKESAASIYALADEAEANNYTLSEDDLAALDKAMDDMEQYATRIGYSSIDAYLKVMYGNGATKDGYMEYSKLSYLATSYYNAYSDSLTYDDAALRAGEADTAEQYSSYSYNSYYVNATTFLEGGIADDEGNTTYSDKEKDDAVAAAEEAAKSLTSDEILTVEDLDTAIGALSINAESETPVTSTAYEDYSYDYINSTIRDWVTDESRVEGDKTYIAYTSHTHAEGETHSDDEDSSEYEVVNGYYVVYFVGSNDNNFPLVNVRHILVAPEGGTYNSTTGLYDYTEEEMAAALTEAEALLAQWEAGDASEESFGALANEKSADSDGTDGGLYTDVYPGQMVTNFNDWCFDEGREKGDTGIVDSVFGWHIMYYSGESETLYRDYLIAQDLRAADMEAWYNALVEAMTITDGNAKYIKTDIVLSSTY